MKAIESFEDYFGADRLASFDEETAVIYGLTSELTLALLNDAWFEFARENNAPDEFYDKYGVGGSYVDCLPEELEDFFVENIRSSMRRRVSWATDYECPSATRYRKFRMQVLPMAREMGCVIVNTCLIDVPHDERDDERYFPKDIREVYFDSDGRVTMCSHCRRTRRIDDPNHWDWIPEFVDYPPDNVSHGICGPCLAYFSPASSLRPRT